MPAPKQNQHSKEMLIDIVLVLLEEGKSMVRIFEDNAEDFYITRSGFRHWIEDDADLAAKYTRAKESGLEKMAEDILEISDETSRDHYTDSDGNEKLNSEAIQRSKLRVDSRRWLLSKLMPKKYGDKITQEHTGPGGRELNLKVDWVTPKKAD